MRSSSSVARSAVGIFFRAFPGALRDFFRHDGLTYAAALAFFFLLSMFPLLIFLASALAYIPVPHLFDRLVRLMSLVIPSGAMGRVKTVLADILRTNVGLLSFGIVGSIWIASLGYDAAINALDLVYEKRSRRSYWNRRALAIELTILTGAMVVAALLIGVLGPIVGSLLPKVIGVNALFVHLWPWIRWVAILALLVLALQLLYCLAPRDRPPFWYQMPGALLAVASWIGSSFVLDWYFDNFARFRVTYGVLGAVIALLMWLYASAIALLIGAEVNQEIAGERAAKNRTPSAIP